MPHLGYILDVVIVVKKKKIGFILLYVELQRTKLAWWYRTYLTLFYLCTNTELS